METGDVEGSSRDGVESFKGIPYAAPPVGELRWKPPQAPAKWPGTRPATEFCHDCMQLPIESDAAPLGASPAEDCLYLNVWRPAGSARGAALPVLVWIHGGGFVNGGSSAPIYDGSAFAREGIVVVSFNYRLGRFGFFAHPALHSEPGPHANYGYMDQRAALEWVQRNIAEFGGDPATVTIAGESAGGQSVIDLMTSHPEEHLYNRAIVMSGGGRWFLGGFPLSGGDRRHPSGERVGEAFARGQGIEGEDSRAAAELRALPAESVRGQANMLALLLTTLLPLGPLQYARGPIVDGEVVLGQAGDRIEQGHISKIPLLIGTTSQDLGMWIPRSKGEVFDWFGDAKARARRVYDPDGKTSAKALALMVGADQTMQEPARFVARRLSNLGSPVWLYRFGYVAESEREKSAGAGHASEMPYFFRTLRQRYGDQVTAKDEATSDAFFTYAANFVKSGDPNGEGLSSWPRYDPSRSDLMQFTGDRGPIVAEDPLRERLDLHESVAGLEPPVTIAELSKSDWSGFVALAVASTPEYLGSDQRQTVPLPLFELQYRERLVASVGTTGLAAAVGAKLMKRAQWSLSGHVGLADRRLASDADALTGTKDHEWGTSAGATLRHQHRFLNESLTLTKGLNSGAGLAGKIGVGLGIPLGFKGAVSLGGSALFVDDDQMRYDFGIDAAEAAERRRLVDDGDSRIGRTQAVLHVPNGGLQSVGGNATILLLLSGRWLGAVTGSVSYLSDKAAESPLVTERTQRTIAAGIGWRL